MEEQDNDEGDSRCCVVEGPEAEPLNKAGTKEAVDEKIVEGLVAARFQVHASGLMGEIAPAMQRFVQNQTDELCAEMKKLVAVVDEHQKMLVNVESPELYGHAVGSLDDMLQVVRDLPGRMAHLERAVDDMMNEADGELQVLKRSRKDLDQTEKRLKWLESDARFLKESTFELEDKLGQQSVMLRTCLSREPVERVGAEDVGIDGSCMDAVDAFSKDELLDFRKCLRPFMPVHIGGLGGLAAELHNGAAAFIKSYNAKSKQWALEAGSCVVHLDERFLFP